MSEKTPSVLVLMSTYNGGKYLKEQLDSVLCQKNVDVSILVRDDGSTDNTLSILEGYTEGLSVIKGNNIGSTKSFFSLVEQCNIQFDYFALCDQDDVWDDNKLYVAIQNLKDYRSKPALYSSNTRIVNENRTLISIEKQNPITSLGSAMVKNYVTGCTTVFNGMLMELLKNRILDIDCKSHEWWINLVCLANNGVSIYDVSAHMDYRQHGNNVVGAPTSIFGKWKERYRKFRTKNYDRPEMAKQLLQKYENLSGENRKMLECFVNGKKRKLNLILTPKIKTKNFIDNICFAVLVLTERI